MLRRYIHTHTHTHSLVYTRDDGTRPLRVVDSFIYSPFPRCVSMWPYLQHLSSLWIYLSLSSSPFNLPYHTHTRRKGPLEMTPCRSIIKRKKYTGNVPVVSQRGKRKPYSLCTSSRSESERDGHTRTHIQKPNCMYEYNNDIYETERRTE